MFLMSTGTKLIITLRTKFFFAGTRYALIAAIKEIEIWLQSFKGTQISLFQSWEPYDFTVNFITLEEKKHETETNILIRTSGDRWFLRCFDPVHFSLKNKFSGVNTYKSIN